MLITKDNSPEAIFIYSISFNKNFEVVKKNPLTLNIKNYDIRFSGDVFFNLKLGFASSRNYLGILEKYYPQSAKDIMKLLLDLTSSILNFKPILSQGNLQSYKKGVGNDRADIFLKQISNYYEDKEYIPFDVYSSWENHSFVFRFLDYFNDIYCFTNIMYNINPNLTDRILSFSQKSLYDNSVFIDYIKMCIAFWQQQKVYISDIIKSYPRNLWYINKIFNDLYECNAKLGELEKMLKKGTPQ